MKIFGKITNESEFKKTLSEFEKWTGKAIEEGIDQIGRSSAKALASKVQPYGLSDEVGAQMMDSVRVQIDRVWYGVNIGAWDGQSGIEQAHNQVRRKGSVPKRKFRNFGRRWEEKISVGEKEAYARKQMAKVGRAKAAWITAGNSLGKTKISGLKKWIRRHVNTGYGAHTRIGRGMKAQIELHNQTPYLRHIQDDQGMEQALRLGRKNGFKALQHAINGAIKKANSK